MFKPAKYGCGGKVVKSYADGGKVVEKGKKKAPKPEPEMLGTGLAANAGKALKGRAKQLADKEKELGLKDGGKAKMKPHVPARVKSPILEKSKKKGYGPGGPHTPGAKGTYPKRK